MTGTLVWLVALVGISLAAAVALRRVSSLAGGTRELERLQMDVAGIDSRLAAAVGPLVEQLDAVRRGAQDPREASGDLEEARAALRTLGGEARALRPPSPLAGRVAQLVWELDRAARAADMAAHGVQTLAAARGTVGTEGQVALKRGTLGLRHAREAVGRIASGLTALTPADLLAMPTTADGAGPIATPGPGPDDDWLLSADEPPTG
jgi:hypothetical protein